MAKKKTEEVVVTRIEAVKSNRVGLSTQNEMNKVTEQLINLVYSLEDRIAALEAKSKSKKG